MLDKFYTTVLPEYFKEMSTIVGDYSVTHSLNPLTSLDIPEDNETSYLRLIDDLEVTNLRNGEQLKLLIDIIDVPYKTNTGYRIKGVNRHVADICEMSKGWHFEILSKLAVGDSQFSSRIVKFIADTSMSELGYYYSFGVRKGNPPMLCMFYKKAFVPLSIFMKGLTGDSFSDIIKKLGTRNKFVINSFSIEEPSRLDCIERCYHTLFPNIRMPVDDKFKIQEFCSKFIGVNAMIGNGSGRMVNMSFFRSHLKNYVLAKSINLGKKTILAGTKLLPELLQEIDYSCVDEISVQSPGNIQIFTFKKYDIYNFRGLNQPDSVRIEDLIQAEDTGTLEYTLPSGEILTRKSAPLCNTPEVIYNVLNLYVNFLSGFDLNSDVYNLENQSLVSVDKMITDRVTDSLLYINQKVSELTDGTSNNFPLRTLIMKLRPFDLKSILNRISRTADRSVQLSSLTNIVASTGKALNVVKNMKHQASGSTEIQHTQMGRLDPFDVPENTNIGLTHNRAIMSRVDKNNQLSVPYLRVDNCKLLSNEPIYLVASDERDQYIGEWDEDFSGETTRAMFNGMLITVHPSKITLIEYSPYQHMSVSRAMSPFPENMAGKRAQMASSHAKQSIYICGAERPLVNTGAESLLPVIDSSIAIFFTANDLIREYCDNTGAIFEEVEETGLKYISFSDAPDGRSFVFSVMNNGVLDKFKKKLPAFHPTFEKSMYGYCINKNLGLHFTGNDIVLHHITYDPKKYDRQDRVNLGNLQVDDKTFDSGSAIGVNLKIGYMTYGSSTIDDAILINDRLVTDNVLSSIYIWQKDFELSRPNEKRIEEFGYADGVIPQGFNVYGLPEIGTYLSAGSVVLYKYMKKISSDPLINLKETYSTNIDLPSTVSGEVISSSIQDNTATIVLVSLSPIEEGDKMSGRYGNKGVISRIVPNHQMPYESATGDVLDVVLNPLGIPSRINLSQVIEVSLAAANKSRNVISVYTPFQSNNVEYVSKLCEENTIKPKQLIIGETGIAVDGYITVGYMYMYKLMQKVSDRINSVGYTHEVDPTFHQPTGGKSGDKGQAFGEMENWCLDSAGAYIAQHELQTIMSNDVESIRMITNYASETPENIDLNPSSFNNCNDVNLNTFFMSSGIRLIQNPEDPSMISLKTMTDDYIKSLNSTNPVNIFDPRNSLRSASCFGGKYDSEDQWSWMSLGGEMPHPYWMYRGKINNFLIVTIREKMESNYRLPDGSIGFYYKDVRRTLPLIKFDQILDCKAFLTYSEGIWFLSNESSPSSLTGVSGFVEFLKLYDLETTRAFYSAVTQSSEKRKKPPNLKCLSLLNAIDDIIADGGLSQYIVSCMPIIPLRFRPEPTIPNVQQDFDYMYTAIAGSAAEFTVNSSPLTMRNTFNYYAGFIGVLGKKRTPFRKRSRSKLLEEDRVYVDQRRYWSEKDSGGKIREKIGKKYIHRSGRSVITPFQDPSISPDRVGVPYIMAIDIWGLELTALLIKNLPDVFGKDVKNKQDLAYHILKNAVLGNEDIVKSICNTSGKSGNRYCFHIKKLISSFVEKQVCIFGRQPSLHKFSIRAHYPVLVESRSIQIHPLCNKGLNADYDGDTGYIAAFVTQAAKDDAWKHLAVQNGIVNPGNGNIIVEPSQDILLGLYYATSFKNNTVLPVAPDSDGNSIITPIGYNNINVMLADLDIDFIKPYDWVSVPVEGRLYVSTAGRIAFNSLLADGFTKKPYNNKYNLSIKGKFSELLYDGVITGRVSDKTKQFSINSIFRSIYDNFTHSDRYDLKLSPEKLEQAQSYDRSRVLKFFQKISEFGFNWCGRSGISYNFDDMKESPMVQEFLSSADKVTKEIDRHFQMGLVSEQGRKEAIQQVYQTVSTKEFKKKFIASLDRNSNVFKMYDSKAKGSEEQIMQSCGLLGVLQKSKFATLDMPIVRNYSGGLSAFDLFETSYSTRLGLLSTILETSKPGELTRTLIYEFSGLCVTNDRCTDDSEPLVIDYKVTSDFVKLNGSSLNKREIYGLKLQDEESLKYAMNLSPDGTINEALFESLKASGLPSFETDAGLVEFETVFPDFWCKVLLNRTATAEYPGLLANKYITEETIEYFKETCPRIIHAMTLMNCVSKDSICSDSYGLRYDPVIPVKVGDFLGSESAQAIGEPSAQLTMSLFHQAGAAGSSIEGGINVIKSALQYADFSVYPLAVCSPCDGYLYIKNTTIEIVSSNGQIYRSPKRQSLIVQDGEYVRVGKPLTKGSVHPILSFIGNSLVLSSDDEAEDDSTVRLSGIINPSVALLTRIRYIIANFYYSIYISNGIDLNGRHFEVPAFLQTNTVTVLKSGNPLFVAGRNTTYGNVYNQSNIDFYLSLGKSFDIILNNAGVIASACYRDVYNVLGKAAISRTPFRERSTLSTLLTGSDLTAPSLSIKSLNVAKRDESRISSLKSFEPVAKHTSSRVIEISTLEQDSIDTSDEIVFDFGSLGGTQEELDETPVATDDTVSEPEVAEIDEIELGELDDYFNPFKSREIVIEDLDYF